MKKKVSFVSVPAVTAVTLVPTAANAAGPTATSTETPVRGNSTAC